MLFFVHSEKILKKYFVAVIDLVIVFVEFIPVFEIDS